MKDLIQGISNEGVGNAEGLNSDRVGTQASMTGVCYFAPSVVVES